MSDQGIFRTADGQEQSCRLSYNSAEIFIYLDTQPEQLVIWPYSRLNSCVFLGSDLIIKFGPPGNEQNLKCSGDIASNIYKQSKLPPEPEKKSKVGRVYWSLLLLMVLFVIGLIIAAWFILVPWLGEKASALVPIETEIALGEQVSKIYSQQNEVNDSATFYLEKFCTKLQLSSAYKVTTQVLQSNEINAFALPGGRIFVYSGILSKMDNYSQLVALLSHEVSHVNKQHSLKTMCRQAASGVAISAVIGDANGISAVLLEHATQFSQLNYSRELETEADLEGLKIMLKNKIPTMGMLELLQMLKNENQEMPSMMKYLSTHPETDERIAIVKSHLPLEEKTQLNKDLQDLFRRIKDQIDRPSLKVN